MKAGNFIKVDNYGAVLFMLYMIMWRVYICVFVCILNHYSLKSRWIVAKYLPSRESGEVNIPKATIHRDWKE